MNQPIKVLMIGPDDTVLGGMTTIQQNYRGHWDHDLFPMRYLGIYCRGSKLKKMRILIVSMVIFILWIWGWRPDLIHIHFSYRAGFYRESLFMMIASLFRQRLVIHSHAPDFEGFYGVQSPLLKAYIRFVLRQADRLLVLSNAHRSYFERLILSSSVQVLYNAVPIPPETAHNQNKPMILLLGELGKRKGVYDLIKIVPQLRLDFPDIQICLGGDGDIEQLAEIIADNQWQEFVHLLGWVKDDEKAHAYQIASIFVLPSYAEGVSMAVLEAMAYGLAVITTPVGGMLEVLTHNVTGVLIQVGDTEALAQEISRLLKDDRLRQQMGDRARQHVQETFSIDRILGDLYSFYCELGV